MKEKTVSTRVFFRNECIHMGVALVVVILCNFLPYRVPEIIEGNITISKSYKGHLRLAWSFMLKSSWVWILAYVLLCAVCLFAVSFLFTQPDDRSKVLRREFLVCVRSFCNVFIVAILLNKFIGMPRPCFFDMCKSAPLTPLNCRYDPTSQRDHRYGVSGRVGSISKCTADVGELLLCHT